MRDWLIPFCAAASVLSIGASKAASTPQQNSCIAERGSVEARVLANRCMMVSGASHPPCSPLNSCVILQEHIDYMCHVMGVAAPECTNATPFTRKHLNWYRTARPVTDH